MLNTNPKDKISIIFTDFDDTLVKHTGLGRGILKEVLKKHNISFNENEYSKLPHYNLEDKLKIFFPKEYETIWPEVNEIFTKRVVKESELFDDTVEVLKELKKRNIKVIIVSTKFERHIKNILKHHNLEEYIAEIIGRETVDPPKPHEKGVNEMLKKYNTNKNNAIFLGDASLDGENALNAKIRFVYIKRKESLHKIPKPWKTIYQLKELIDILE